MFFRAPDINLTLSCAIGGKGKGVLGVTTPPMLSNLGDASGPHSNGKGPCLLVLGGFSLRFHGEAVHVPLAARRLLALLALGDLDSRATLAGTLWPEKNQTRAAANLRAALWRLPRELRDEIDSTGPNLVLSDRWSVDLADARALAKRLRAGVEDPDQLDPRCFCGDLLVDWDEPWLTIERERFHQLRIHVLETLAVHQLERGDYAAAAEIALAAIAAEPLRESAYALLLRAELESGNRASAVEQFRRVEALLQRECGVKPGPRLYELVSPLFEEAQNSLDDSSAAAVG